MCKDHDKYVILIKFQEMSTVAEYKILDTFLGQVVATEMVTIFDYWGCQYI